MNRLSFIQNKKGSVTVFVMMFMVSMIMLFTVLIRASENAAVKGSFGALGTMWCDSILAEYDKNLQDRYDIFAFYGLQPEISMKLRFYAGESLLDKRYVRMSGAESSLAGYSLIDSDNFKEQIIRAAKMRAACEIAGKPNEYRNHGPAQPRTESAASLTSDLPSGGSSLSITAPAFRHAVESAGSIKDIIKESGDRYLENRYAFMYFKDRSDDRGLGRTFFSNEIEYLISGKKNDEENNESLKLKIIAVRLIFNTIYAFEDPEINAETAAAAEIITPGPAAAATQKALQTGWAACESVNDYNLLINGKKVPLYKDSGSWALSLEMVIRGGIRESTEGDPPRLKEEAPLVDPGNEHGETYHDYLQAMLYLMDEDVKLLRMMDLIQINMRFCHYADFRVREYNTGLKALFEVNGGKYDVERCY